MTININIPDFDEMWPAIWRGRYYAGVITNNEYDEYIEQYLNYTIEPTAIYIDEAPDMATKVEEKPKETDKPSQEILDASASYIEQIYKLVAGTYFNDLGAEYPTIKTKVALRSYDNPDPVKRRKYYIDQLYHIINEAIQSAIEKDSPLAGQLDRRANISFNKDGYITYHIYNMPASVVDMYAHLIAFLCAFKATSFMTKVMSQPLFSNVGSIDFNRETDITKTLPFLGPITRDIYTNFALSTRRGNRNRQSFNRFNTSLIYGMLGINPPNNGDNVADNPYLLDRYVDTSKIWRSLTGYDSNLRYGDGLRRLSYIHLLQLRLLNSIDTSDNIFAGYGRNLDMQNITKMLVSDVCMLPIWDSVMGATGFIPGEGQSLAGSTSGFIDTNNKQNLLEDIYGWSDQQSNDIYTAYNRSLTTLIETIVKPSEDTLLALHNYLSQYGPIANNYGAPASFVRANSSPTESANAEFDILEDLRKSQFGAMSSKHWMLHSKLGSNFYDYMNWSCSLSNDNPLPVPSYYYSGSQANPDEQSLVSTMYIACDNLLKQIAERDEQTIQESSLRSFGSIASTNFQPASLIADLLSKRLPKDVLGFEVSTVPTAEDIQRISSFLQSKCKLVFATTDPLQQALRRSHRLLTDAGSNVSSIMRSYKCAITVATRLDLAIKENLKMLSCITTTTYPFRIPRLASSIIHSKYDNFYSRVQGTPKRRSNARS